jgi:hypothetical protein
LVALPAAAPLRYRDGDRPATKGEVFALLARLSDALDGNGYRKLATAAGKTPRAAAGEKLAALAGRAALTDAEVCAQFLAN